MIKVDSYITETQYSSGNLRYRDPEIRNIFEGYAYIYRHERHILDEQAGVG